MTHKTWWTALALAAFWGCDTGPQHGVNNTVPESPGGMKHGGSGGGMPTPTDPKDIPSTYPGANQGQTAPADTPKVDEPKADTPKVDEPKADAPKGDEPKADAPKGDAPKAASVSLSADQIAQIKKLPEGEQASALKQKVCPVSGETLGDMGMPVKATAGGETFYLCCKGCQDDLKDEAKLKTILTVLAKMPK